MKRVLVTGADGQLGKCLQKISKKYPDLNFDFMGAHGFDITKADQVEAVFNSETYDYCINCAGYTNVEQAEKTPEKAFAVNSEGVRLIALACRPRGIIMVHISTDYVFDGEKEGPYATTDKPNPINEYGKSKLAGEQHVQKILDAYYIIRTSWLYSEFGHNFYKSILAKARKGETLYITDAEKGCPTNANHLAAYLLDTILDGKKEYGVHHFTDGEAMSW
ncbi:MAG TPA: NAD(P)-dependent oxidoreductase, partial [Eudoraea sp.]|nr:NAD(P)-dependent oxidoreductase [Eudoraea sp.]